MRGHIDRLNSRLEPDECVQLIADIQGDPELSEWNTKILVGAAKQKLARAKRRGSAIRPKMKEQVRRRDRDLCRYCGYSALRGMSAIDHIVPVCQGGLTEIANLALACTWCNGKKGGRTPEQAGMPLLMPGTTAQDVRRTARRLAAS